MGKLTKQQTLEKVIKDLKLSEEKQDAIIQFLRSIIKQNK